VAVMRMPFTGSLSAILSPTRTAGMFASIMPRDRLVRRSPFSNYCLCASPLMLVARPPSFAESVRFVFSPRAALSMDGSRSQRVGPVP
jgi:hypothetical protein